MHNNNISVRPNNHHFGQHPMRSSQCALCAKRVHHHSNAFNRRPFFSPCNVCADERAHAHVFVCDLLRRLEAAKYTADAGAVCMCLQSHSIAASRREECRAKIHGRRKTIKMLTNCLRLQAFFCRALDIWAGTALSALRTNEAVYCIDAEPTECEALIVSRLARRTVGICAIFHSYQSTRINDSHL